jgi:hypothetical protein
MIYKWKNNTSIYLLLIINNKKLTLFGDTEVTRTARTLKKRKRTKNEEKKNQFFNKVEIFFFSLTPEKKHYSSENLLLCDKNISLNNKNKIIGEKKR